MKTETENEDASRRSVPPDGSAVNDLVESARIDAAIQERVRMRPTIRSGHGREGRNFRWAYMLLVELAKVELEIANSEAKAGEWPAGQEWHELSGSSKACFLGLSRKRVGISDDEFLADIRSGLYDVDDLFASDQKLNNNKPN